MMNTLAYYDKNAESYAQSTFGLDMADFRQEFSRGLPVGGRILDAGCGAGRDVAAFTRAGFEVTAFDGCEELVAMACKHTENPAYHLRFEQLSTSTHAVWLGYFDGVWACASLLHLDDEALNKAIGMLSRFLVEGGMFYLSFKQGEGARTDKNGRFYNDFKLDRLLRLPAMAGLELVRDWTTGALLDENAQFLSILARKR